MLNRNRNCCWIKNNWLLVLLFIVLFILPLGLLAYLGFDLYTNIDKQIPNLTAKVATLIAPLLPGISLLQSLIRSGQKWFDETRLALHKYETSVENRNREIEATYERTVRESLQSNPRLQQLEWEVQELEREYAEQKQVVPINQYATLSAFISDRLEQGTYKNRLGLMQQVQQDLTDLSNKLLLPSQDDPSRQAKIGFSRDVFPRGPARVVIYIDDLDRCPPNCVIDVLEAVQLLIKTPLFITVIAIDERYITRALEKRYEGILIRKGQPSGTDYLEKIIQIPYRVSPIASSAIENYLNKQMDVDPTLSKKKMATVSQEDLQEDSQEQEIKALLRCCQQIELSPRMIKRLVNIYNIFKIRDRLKNKVGQRSYEQTQTILSILALSARYPDFIREVFEKLDIEFEEFETLKNKFEKLKKLAEKYRIIQAEETKVKNIELKVKVKDIELKEKYTELKEKKILKFFPEPFPESDDTHLQREYERINLDATALLEDVTLAEFDLETFNLVRSFCFFGDIGYSPEDSQKARLQKTKKNGEEKPNSSNRSNEEQGEKEEKQ
jgi:hypothetical protein